MQKFKIEIASNAILTSNFLNVPCFGQQQQKRYNVTRNVINDTLTLSIRFFFAVSLLTLPLCKYVCLCAARELSASIKHSNAIVNLTFSHRKRDTDR